MLLAGDRLDQFDVVSTLGHGVYATTYLAVDRTSGERVVLKAPTSAVLADPELAARFQREALITRRLRHPNIQGGARAAIQRDSPYLVAEYVDGRSLREWLQSAAPPTLEEALAVVIQIADALAYAHAQGVFHRDLKPENVLVQPNGQVKVIDFGNARLRGARRLTWRVRGETAGTPDYMAPEQIEGGRGDARTDLYALGVILFELVTGQPPFNGDNANAVMYQHVHNPPPLAAALRPDVPAGLEAIIQRTLAKQPEARCQHAADLADDLRGLAIGDAPHMPADRAARGWRTRLARYFHQRSAE